MRKTDVVIIGAGLAGLCCARKLQRAGLDCLVLEGSDGPGGRVRTDAMDGFLFDRGFQVFLTAYPEARRELDYHALDLCEFKPGAIIRRDERFHTVADPWREPGTAFCNLFNPIGTLADKLRVVKLVRRACAGSFKDVFERPETTTERALRGLGFTTSMIDSFFRPFLGGIMLGRDLQTSSRMLDLVIRMMASGATAVPSMGMGQIPRQLAEDLDAANLRYGTRVESIEEGAVRLADGSIIEAAQIVVATEGPEASRLLKERIEPSGSRSVLCLYFAAERPPHEGPWLVLNGERDAFVNNLVVLSQVSDLYAPHASHLVSVTVVGPGAALDEREAVARARRELTGWYGSEAMRWEFLRAYRIRHAQPDQRVRKRSLRVRETELARWLHVCGDHRHDASINGAMRSGRLAAQGILEGRKAGRAARRPVAVSAR
jgi:phytoene dehydrogenase-like protein